ncbi:hypothetical protein [aff. Roholtiella sp. LEGE 12411]|uniref:hypothetical protein n=1 Tax=aff. Roholtiella sp. LEGE 12411 TaxID=1828822 RepID=UPI00187FD9B5|nr:hypothetical protein [aff. Roholtiella sp. LEGE 12411]
MCHQLVKRIGINLTLIIHVISSSRQEILMKNRNQDLMLNRFSNAFTFAWVYVTDLINYKNNLFQYFM